MCRLNIMNKLLLAVTTVLVMVSCGSVKKEEVKKESIEQINEVADFSASEVLDLSAKKIKETSLELTNPNEFLRNISKGSKDWNVVGVKDWCSGFWPGVLWYAYEASGDEVLREEAERFTAP